MGCKRQGVIISELSLLQGRKRFLGVVVSDFVGTVSCLTCAGLSSGTECCLIIEAGMSLGIGKEDCLKAELSFFSDFQGFV